MKRLIFVLALVALASCDISLNVDNPIDISSPDPVANLTKVTLTKEQQAYVNSGNAFAFNCLSDLCKGGTDNLIFSPLSLQYALAMTVNGASGQTAEEIIATLGYGTDLNALNTYCNLLLNQLPALDKDVTLKLTDAMLALKDFPVQDGFKKVMNETYYAPVEYIDPANVQEIVDRINEWAARNTNGLIKPFLSKDDISDDFVAAIMNALYFKAKWAEGEHGAMFFEDATMKNETFYKDGGGKAKADMMRTSQNLPYAKRNGYSVVAIPYAGGNFAMYILLPDEKGKDGASKLVKQLVSENWAEIMNSMNNHTLINLRLPKFECESKFGLVETMTNLGIKKAFIPQVAEFDSMFIPHDGYYFWISNIIQKAKISVAEWGTEAAAVTAVIMDKASAMPAIPKIVDFFADHPFVYVIAERTSGAILFEGVYAGR